MNYENVEELFQELDENQYSKLSGAMWAYMRSLMKQGFTRRESFNLVQGYSKFLYDMTLEEFISQKRMEEDNALEQSLSDEEDVDPFDEDQYNE